MGREIRRVPADWKHPTYADRGLHYYSSGHNDNTLLPLFDASYAEALENAHDEDEEEPEARFYRAQSWTEQEATHYQVYETVSEGTPVSPVFSSLQELEDWLVNDGTWAPRTQGVSSAYLTQIRSIYPDIYTERRVSRVAAQKFCRSGWVPSMLMQNGIVYQGIEAATTFETSSKD